jgi:hypothetical protein
MDKDKGKLENLRERAAWLGSEIEELRAHIDEHLAHTEKERHLHVVEDFLGGYEETG